MTTEDDTFARLRKTPFVELRKHVAPARVAVFMGMAPIESVIAILERHGWTLDEYDSELEKLPSISPFFRVKPLPNGDFKVDKGID